VTNVRNLRARLKSAESTCKITKSMKMVSAAKLHRVQNLRGNLSNFSDTCEKILKKVMSTEDCASQPMLRRNEGNRVCYVLFVGNRGLCGSYNMELIKFFESECAENADMLVVCGRWGTDVLSSFTQKVIKCFDEMSDTPTQADAAQLSDYLRQLYIGGECSSVVLVYQSFLNVMKQQPTAKTLLPLTGNGDSGKAADMIFEPDRKTIVDRLAELYFSNTVYSVLLEAKAGEHASRLTAMTSASDSTEKLIDKLKLELNHIRQSAITTEISEVSGGANALNRVNDYE